MNYSECSLDRLLSMRASIDAAVEQKKEEEKSKQLADITKFRDELQELMRTRNVLITTNGNNVILTDASEETSIEVKLHDGMKW